MAPPIHPITPLCLRPAGPAFPSSRASASSSFSVSSLLLPTTCSSYFPSLSAPAPPPFPCASIPPPQCFVPAPPTSAHTVVSWSLPSVPSCSAPSFSSVAPRASSFVPTAFSLVLSAPLPPPPATSLLPSSSLPYSLAPPPSFASSTSASFSAPPPCTPVAPHVGISSGAPHSASSASTPSWSGAAGSLDFDDSSVKEEAVLSKAAFSKAIHKVVSLVMGFFPCAKPDSSSSSTEDSVPWEDICVPSSGFDPRIFLSLFDKMKSLSKEVCEKFQKAADERKKASSALPRWGDAYRLGDFPDYHKALCLNPLKPMRKFALPVPYTSLPRTPREPIYIYIYIYIYLYVQF